MLWFHAAAAHNCLPPSVVQLYFNGHPRADHKAQQNALKQSIASYSVQLFDLNVQQVSQQCNHQYMPM